MTSKVSFTIRRPPSSSGPISQHTPSQSRSSSRSASFVPHQVDSSEDEADENATELVTGFDQFGAQRLREKPKASGPMVIAPLANRDWRVVARSRKQLRFLPDGASAMAGKDGSQGGLGTRDTLNSGPQATGLVQRERMAPVEVTEGREGEAIVTEAEKVEESEDERARRALLASVDGSDVDIHAVTIDIIPTGDNAFARAPISETDAYKQDVVSRPDSSTLQDYERVPVSQFGAALLRGMGWKEGTAASRTRGGLVEPWLPTSRPALLGIGAKERPAEDIPASGNGGPKIRMPEKRYVPLLKVEREGSARPPPPSRSRSRSPSRSGTASRVGSKASSPYPSDKERRHKHSSRDRNLDRYGYDDRDRRSGDRRERQRDSDRTPERKGGSDDRRDKRIRRDEEGEDRDERGRDSRRNERDNSTRNGSTRY